MRLLHLVDSREGRMGPGRWALLGDLVRAWPAGESGGADEHRIVTLGPRLLLDAGASEGLRRLMHPLPGGNGNLFQSWAALQWGELRRRRPDVIIAWTEWAASLACLARGPFQRFAMLIEPPPPGGGAGLLNWRWRLARRAGLRVLGVGPTGDEAGGGLIESPWPDCPVGQVGLGMDLPRIHGRPGGPPHESRATLRAGWGVEDERTLVALLVGDPDQAQAMQMMLQLGLGLASGRKLRMVVGPRMRGVDRVQEMLGRLGWPQAIIIEPRVQAIWRVAAGCDLAIVNDSPPGRWNGGYNALGPLDQADWETPDSPESAYSPNSAEGVGPAASGAASSAAASSSAGLAHSPALSRELEPGAKFGGGLPMLWALACGLPMVAERTAWNLAWAADVPGIHWVEAGDIKHAAKIILRLEEEFATSRPGRQSTPAIQRLQSRCNPSTFAQRIRAALADGVGVL